MAKKRVKAKDVAEWAGVSQTTVSMVLNNYSNASISEETRQRVFKACEELGYVVRKAGFRSDEQSRIILMVCPSFDNQHYAKVLNSAQQRAIELGFEPVVFCTQRKEAEEARLVGLCRQLNVSGVLMAYSPYNSSAYRLLSMEVPHVLIYDKTFNTNTNIIALDNYKIGLGTAVAYDGSQNVLQAVLNGELDFALLDDNFITSYVDSGELTAVMCIGETESKLVSAPAMSSYGITGLAGVVGIKWLAVRADTPDDICQYLRAQAVAAIESEQYQNFLQTANYGTIDTVYTEEELEVIKNETLEVYKQVLTAIGLA